MRDAGTELLNAFGPVMLVVVLGNDDLRRAGTCRGGGGARTAVVHDRHDAVSGRGAESGLLLPELSAGTGRFDLDRQAAGRDLRRSARARLSP